MPFNPSLTNYAYMRRNIQGPKFSSSHNSSAQTIDYQSGVLEYMWVKGVLLQRIFLKLASYLKRFHFTRTRKIESPWSFKSYTRS